MQAMIDYSNILKAFVEEKIDFTVVGGFAVLAHGVIRITMDLDLAISTKPEELKMTWGVLERLGFVPRQPISKSQFIDPAVLLDLSESKNLKAVSFYHQQQPYLVVDLLFTKEFQLNSNEKMSMDLFGVSCQVATIEKLIQLKTMAGRDKDLEDIRELSKISEKKE